MSDFIGKTGVQSGIEQMLEYGMALVEFRGTKVLKNHGSNADFGYARKEYQWEF